MRKVNGVIPLPERVRSSRVHLRWLASIPNLTCFAVLVLAIVTFYGLSAYLGSVGQSGAGRESAAGRQHLLHKQFVNTPTGDNDRGGMLGQYDAHVQPLIRWEKPGQGSSGSHVNSNSNRNNNNINQHRQHYQHNNNHNQQQRQRAATRTQTPPPSYTIELQEI